MKLRGSTYISIILLTSAYIRDVICPDPDYSELGRFMDNFCPYNVICRTGPPKLLPDDEAETGCCTDCSCEDTCGLTQDCCFDSLDTYHLVDRSHQECTMPTTYTVKDERAIAFNMVVDDFPNGKGIHCGDNITTCGDNVTATPIGSLYPVSSKKTGRIYKNIECAKCHGLLEEDVIKWQVWLACDKSTSLFPVDVMSSLNSIETGKLSTYCGYEFVYPGPLSDIKTEQCIAHPIDSCVGNFNLFGLNLTHEEVRFQCSNGVYSPFKVRYRNIFCYICAPFLLEVQTDRVCNKMYTKPTRLGAVAFAALIDDNVLQNNRDDKQQMKTKPRVACPKENEGIDMDTEACREVFCPTGQILLQNGKCVYPSKQWGPAVFTLNIKLVPQTDIKEDTLLSGGFDFSAMLTDQTLSPWPRLWTPMMFAYTIKTSNDSERVIDHFFVKIKARKQRTQIELFLNTQIKNALWNDWYMNFKGTRITNKQSLSEFIDFIRIGYRSGNGYKYTHIQYPSSSLDLPEFTIYSELMFFHLMPSLSITKMFFCDQIQLKPDEYELYPEAKLLFHNQQNRFYFLGEFTTVFDKEERVRICVEDSFFQISTSASSSISLRKGSFVLLYVLLIHVVWTAW